MPPLPRYAFTDNRPATPPDYGRSARALSDAELEDEILAKRGEPDYQLALLAELEARAKKEGSA